MENTNMKKLFNDSTEHSNLFSCPIKDIEELRKNPEFILNMSPEFQELHQKPKKETRVFRRKRNFSI